MNQYESSFGYVHVYEHEEVLESSLKQGVMLSRCSLVRTRFSEAPFYLTFIRLLNPHLSTPFGYAIQIGRSNGWIYRSGFNAGDDALS